MLSFRNQLLQTFGIGTVYAAIMSGHIQLQNASDCEPFAEIITDKQGQTVLRVGQIQPMQIPIIKIR